MQIDKVFKVMRPKFQYKI